MLDWLTSRLHHRLLLGTLAGLLFAVLAFALLFLGLYQSELRQQRAEVATQVNRLLQTSLENAMLKRDLQGLRHIVNSLGQQPDITQVLITDPDGEVRFSSNPQVLGQRLNTGVATAQASTRFVVDTNGRDILRSIKPVANKAACAQCHGSVASSQVNGVLYVDYDAAVLKHKARSSLLWLTGTGALLALICLGGGWWFLHRYVLRPVEKLTSASESISQGNLGSRVELEGNDEFARLGHSFNTMAGNLQASMKSLSDSEFFLQSLIDGIPDGVRLIDQDFKVRLANRSYRQQLGLDEQQACGYCYEAPHGRNTPCEPLYRKCPVHEIMRDETPINVVHRHRHQDGTELDVEIHASPMRAMIDGREQRFIVESIRNLQQDIRYSQEQKMSELGRLAAGVAHEIYNPLSSLRMAMHALRQGLPDALLAQEDTVSLLEIADREVDSCIKITERMLKLSTPAAGEWELVNLKDCIADTISLLNWEAENHDITLSMDLAPGLRVLARDSEIRMVALNLAQNAFHAMPEGGRLQVTAQRTEGRVEIHFADNGFGIAEDDQQRIFEPFFSRRADGKKGTGLGLAISRSIIEKYKGQITAESKVGKGSRFIIHLPDPDADFARSEE